VLIATPVSTHFPIAAAALRHGKHVFVEKPLAASSEEAEALIELSVLMQRVLMPGHTFILQPAGEHDSLADRQRRPRRRSTSSPRAGSTSGSISRRERRLGSRAARLLDPALLAQRDAGACRGDEPRLRPAANARRRVHQPRVPLGIIAHVELAWLAPSKLRRTTVVGSEKMVVYDDTSNESVRVFDAG